MKGLSLNSRMAFLRKTSCILTILFVVVATVFLLVYPLFIDGARSELEYAYDNIEVSGWLFNGKGFTDPVIDADTWHTLLDSGTIGAHYSYTAAELRLFDAWYYEGLLEPASSDDAALEAYEQVEKSLVDSGDTRTLAWKNLKGINTLEAQDGLARQAGDIQWAQGWSADCLATDQPVCLVPESLGFQPGDQVPFRLKSDGAKHVKVTLRAAGVYPQELSDANIVLPLATLEDLFEAQGEEWNFWINGFSFLVKDNRALPQLKDKLIEMELTSGNVRAAIDDRILDGTVSPIKSNLAMLEGLYGFFFAVVAVIGFFLCFLLARGRKQEYAVMRLLGESQLQVTCKAILEQLVLCLIGIALGAGILLAAGQGTPDLKTCAVILICYTLGAAVAVAMTVRVNVMEILRDKE